MSLQRSYGTSNRYVRFAAAGAKAGYQWYNRPGNAQKVQEAEAWIQKLLKKRKREENDHTFQEKVIKKRLIANPVSAKAKAVPGALPKMINKHTAGSKVKSSMSKKPSKSRRGRKVTKRTRRKTKRKTRRAAASSRRKVGMRASFEDFRMFSLLAKSNQSNLVDIYSYLGVGTGVANNDTIGLAGTLAINSIITDFKQGESTGFPPRSGLFDAPKAPGWTSTGLSTDTISPVNSSEVLTYDSYGETVYFTNGTNDVVHVKVQVFSCGENSEHSLQIAEQHVYDGEQFYVANSLAGNIPQTEPLYDATKLPGLKKWWKLKQTKHYALQPSMEASFHHNSKCRYDQQKWATSNAASDGPIKYMKGKTHLIRITVRGGLGLSSAGAGYVTSKLGIVYHRYVKGHREEMTGATKTQYLNNHTYIPNFLTAGATITEPPVTEVSGSVSLVTPANF